MNKRQLGSDFEEKACDYLTKQGYSIIERNFRTHKGEIDIIAKEGDCLVFVEVKYRSGDKYGYSAAAVNSHKQKIIYRVAEGYLSYHKEYQNKPCRFDVIAFDCNNMTHIKNAFGGI